MRELIEKWANYLWTKIAYNWSIADNEGKVKIVLVLAVGGYIAFKIIF